MYSSNLTVSLIQANLFWEQPAANLEHFNSFIEGMNRSDLIILPEMFNTGFSMNVTQLAEDWNGETLSWLKKMAYKSGAVILGSVMFKEKAKFYNRLLAVFPDHSVSFYDKRHLFRLGNEQEHYTRGEKIVTIQLKDWKIRLLICYDLRFPVWSRNSDECYDLLVYVANWPASRIYAWKTLLAARAIENQCYVIGVNRTGKDGNSIRYSGESLLIDALGKSLNKPVKNEESVISQTLSLKSLAQFRKKFPVLADREHFTINNMPVK